MQAAQGKRLKILQAAVEIVANEGLYGMSFNRLAGSTDISKGGILYHFESKDALLKSLVGHISQVFAENYKTMLASQRPYPGRAVLAYLKAALEGHLGEDLYKTLIAITVERPDLLNVQTALYRQLRRDIEADGGDFLRQWTLVAAFDGLWIDYNTHVYGLDISEHKALGQFLLSEAQAIAEKGKK